MTIKSSNLGFPRIGNNREWKRALEAYWASNISEEQLNEEMTNLRLQYLKQQKEKGIEIIPVGDFTYYDHVLDHAVMFGLVPDRYDSSESSLSTYFAMARGSDNATACEMTKWFNTNYHYIVPEINDMSPSLVENYPLQAYLEAKNELGIDGKPVIIGPYTFLKLSKGYEENEFEALLEKFVPVYEQLLSELEQNGVQWVQMDEPAFVTDLPKEGLPLIASVYERLHEAAPNLNILLQSYFDAVDHYEALVQLPVQGIGLDFVHGKEQNLQSLKSLRFPDDKILGVGLIDGRNIWRADLQKKANLLKEIAEIVPYERQILQPSCSLLHVPLSLEAETNIEPVVKNALAFAEEKIDELTILTEAIRTGNQSQPVFEESSKAILELKNSSYRNSDYNQAHASDKKTARTVPFEERQVLQTEKWSLPLLPTTTIGSFPQTAEVRRARQLWRKGEWDNERYTSFIKAEIKKWIELQEEIGLDVLVHGEFERTDMVEFFGEKLDGFIFTKNAWVQSYGSRCVKPPIIVGDVHFNEPMTVAETIYAQSLTDKPVKGMLTGPVTILNWSFVRDDIPREQVTYQIAHALQKEVESLETAGIEMIQVDEPALREGLPLKKKNWNAYLTWATEAFRIATSSVNATTQIHTHMCYSEFEDIIDAIRALDADVISIEASRSHGELISAFEQHTYNKGIGLGVYDIHSPRVPAQTEMVNMIKRALRVLPSERFWINPDCGLKTRAQKETVAALKTMVQAAQEMRKTRATPVSKG